ncbi:hypothetical protein FJZ40_02865, partial [Candidatus Shapirobacteria bacterium]|nr:hypothetical protein [Candidatus Shapirobacteria bacterium]
MSAERVATLALERQPEPLDIIAGEFVAAVVTELQKLRSGQPTKDQILALAKLFGREPVKLALSEGGQKSGEWPDDGWGPVIEGGQKDVGVAVTEQLI